LFPSHDLRGTRRKVRGGVNPLMSLYTKGRNLTNYEDYPAALATAKTLAEIAAGTTFDPVIGLYRIFMEGFDERAMYELLGISQSYRPNQSKKRKTKPKKVNKTTSDESDIMFEEETFEETTIEEDVFVD